VLAKNCSIPLKIIIVDTSPPENRFSQNQVNSILEGSKHDGTVLYDCPVVGNVGAARAHGLNFCLKNTNCQYFINLDDDAVVLKTCIERLVAVPFQEPEFGYVGSAGNYPNYWRKDYGWEDNHVKFYHNIGVCYLVTADFVSNCGGFDPNLQLREDVELGLRAWKNGYYVAAVHAPLIHQRSSSTFIRGNDLWMEASNYIVKKYPDLVTLGDKGNLKPIFKYPEIAYRLNENYELYDLSVKTSSENSDRKSAPASSIHDDDLTKKIDALHVRVERIDTQLKAVINNILRTKNAEKS